MVGYFEVLAPTVASNNGRQMQIYYFEKGAVLF